VDPFPQPARQLGNVRGREVGHESHRPWPTRRHPRPRLRVVLGAGLSHAPPEHFGLDAGGVVEILGRGRADEPLRGSSLEADRGPPGIGVALA
jgi:hypothetical protein